jgi:hypothetical protein
MRVATFAPDGRLRSGVEVERLDALAHAGASLVAGLAPGEAQPGDVWIANDVAGGPTALDLTVVVVEPDGLRAGRVRAAELARTQRRLGADRFGQGLVVPWLRVFAADGPCDDEHALLRSNVLDPDRFAERLEAAVEELCQATPVPAARTAAGTVLREAVQRLGVGERVVELPPEGRLLIDVREDRLRIRTEDAPVARAGNACSLALASRAAVERAVLMLLSPATAVDAEALLAIEIELEEGSVFAPPAWATIGDRGRLQTLEDATTAALLARAS